MPRQLSPQSSLIFIPNLLKSPAASKRTNVLPACPTRQPFLTAAYIPAPGLTASRRPTKAVLSRNAPTSFPVVPSIPSLSGPARLPPLPLIDVSQSRVPPGIPEPNVRDHRLSEHATLVIEPETKPSTHRRGHRHTDESRRKIGIANRGNTPWNKGRRHSEATRRKIAENTKRAMLRPEMRQMLQQRARGRRHSEATKLKIRETARLTRGTAKGAKRRERRRPVRFVFEPDVIKQLNENVSKQIETSFVRDEDDESHKYVVREKRQMSEETKAKLSRRIKDLWSDPEYRSRVACGVEERFKRLSESRPRSTEAKSTTSEVSRKDKAVTSEETRNAERKKSPTKRRARSKVKTAEESRIEKKEEHLVSSPERHDAEADIVLDPDELAGWTKEDLGLVGDHKAGVVVSNLFGDPEQVGELEICESDSSHLFTMEPDISVIASQLPTVQVASTITGSHSHVGNASRHPLRANDDEQLNSLARDPRLPSFQCEEGVDLSNGGIFAPNELGIPGDGASPFVAGVHELDLSRLDIAAESNFVEHSGEGLAIFNPSASSLSDGAEIGSEFRQPAGNDEIMQSSVVGGFEYDVDASYDENGNASRVVAQSPATNCGEEDQRMWESLN